MERSFCIKRSGLLAVQFWMCLDVTNRINGCILQRTRNG